MKARFSRSVFLLKNASTTWKIIAALIAFQSYLTLFDDLQSAQQFFGLSWHELSNGKVFQLVSHILVHANWTHLALNAVALLLLGSKLEHMISKGTIELLSIHSAILGGVFFILLSPSNQTLVGASSVCFGFLLLLLTLSSESKFLPVFFTGKSLGIAIILANLLLSIIHPQLPTGPFAEMGSRIAVWFPNLFKASHACHLGGSLAGWLYGVYLLRPRVTLKTLQKQRAERDRERSEP